MNYKFCPRCECGMLYIFKKHELTKRIILCNECDAMWLEDMDIQYGTYGKDFYDYTTYMEEHGIHNPWEQKNMFETPIIDLTEQAE